MTIINVDGTREERTVELAEDPGYHALKRVLGPIFDAQRGWRCNFQHVSVLLDDARADMFVDDMGALVGMELPENLEATKIFHAASIRQDGLRAPDGIISEAPKIHGVAVLFNRRVWF